MSLRVPDLDTLGTSTFDELVEEARGLIPIHAKEWTDHNHHDPGMMLVDLFAWFADMAIYATATPSVAAREAYGRLLGLRRRDAEPARLRIWQSGPPLTAPARVPKGTQLRPDTGGTLTYETTAATWLVPARVARVYTHQDGVTADRTAANVDEGASFAAFGSPAAPGAALQFEIALSETGTWVGPGGRRARYIDLHLALDPKEDPDPGAHDGEAPRLEDGAQLTWATAVGNEPPLSVDIAKDTTQGLTRDGFVRIVLDDDFQLGAQSLTILCTLADGHYLRAPTIRRAGLNVLTCRQVETHYGELIGTGQGVPNQRAKLEHGPLLSEEGKPQLKILTKLADQEQQWKRAEKGLHEAGPRDHCYELDTERGEIRFGNGVNGAIPPKDAVILATSYRTCQGAGGRVAEGVRWEVRLIPSSGGAEAPGLDTALAFRGENREPARGGKDPETIADLESAMRRQFRNRFRAVSSADHVLLAMRTPGARVMRAFAFPRYDGRCPHRDVPDLTTVVIIPYTRPRGHWRTVASGDPPVRRAVQAHLDRHRLLGERVRVVLPLPIDVSISCRLHLREQAVPADVRTDARQALRDLLDPETWPLGRALQRSDVFAALDSVAGVEFVDRLDIEHMHDGAPVASYPRTALPHLASFDDDIVLFDSDWSPPEPPERRSCE